MYAFGYIITFQAKTGLVALKITISLLMVQVTSHPERRVGFQLHYALHPWGFFTVLPKSFTSSFPIQASPAVGFCGAKWWLFSKLEGERKSTLLLPE